jgi:hypothetical protein
VIRNRAYLGEARQGEIVNPHAHEPIVTQAEWDAAQPSRKVVLRKEESHSAVCVLRGTLVCGGCGKRMLVAGGSDRKGRARAPHYYCRGRHSTGLCPARASATHRIVDNYVEEQLVAAFGERGPLAEALVRQDRLEEAAREVDAARYVLGQYVSNTTLIEMIGLEMFTKGAEEHQRRVELAELALAEVRAEQEAVPEPIDGDLLRAWKSGKLNPLERRMIVSGMVDRIVLHRCTHKGRKTSADIGERVQIVLKGNELLVPTDTVDIETVDSQQARDPSVY